MASALTDALPVVLTGIRQIFAHMESSASVANFPVGNVHTQGFAVLGENVTFTPDQERLPREAQTPVLGQFKGRTGVQKGTKFSFKLPLMGLGGSGGGDGVDTTSLTSPTWAKLLEACGFSPTTQTGTKLSAASVTAMGRTTLTVDDASGIMVGSPIAVPDANGVLHVSKVYSNPNVGGESPAAGDIVVEPPLTGADNAVVYVPTYYTQGDSGKYVSFIIIGDGYAYRLSGCRGIISSVELDAQKRAMAEFSFEVASFDSGLDVSDLGDTSTIYTAAQAEQGIIVEKSPFTWGNDATFATPVGMGKLDPGSKITPKTTTAARNAIGGFAHTDLHPVLSISPYYDHGWETEFDNGTVRLAIIQAGYQAGSMVAIMLPEAQVTKYPGMADKDGLVTQDVQLHGTINPATRALGLVIALF